MVTELQSGTVEIRMGVTGAVWRGHVEGQGGHHLRVELIPSEVGALPSWAPGTALDCAMESPDGRYYIAASIIRQEGPSLWLEVPTVWSREERRRATRMPGGFPVTYTFEGVQGTGACLDIGVGGLKMRVARNVPLRARLWLRFSLPGDRAPLRLEGLVVYFAPSQESGSGIDIGVKFVNMLPTDGLRIASFCRI